MNTTPDPRFVLGHDDEAKHRETSQHGQPPIGQFRRSTTTFSKHPGPPTTTGGAILTIVGVVVGLFMLWFDWVADPTPAPVTQPGFKPPQMPSPVVYTPPPPLTLLQPQQPRFPVYTPRPLPPFNRITLPRPQQPRLPVYTPMPLPPSVIRPGIPRRLELAPLPREVSRAN